MAGACNLSIKEAGSGGMSEPNMGYRIKTSLSQDKQKQQKACDYYVEKWFINWKELSFSLFKTWPLFEMTIWLAVI